MALEENDTFFGGEEANLLREDAFFGGEEANLLREELQEMDSEFLIPHATPTKEPGCLTGSFTTDDSTDSESDEPSIDMINEGTFEKRIIDIREERIVSGFKEATCGCSLNSGGPCSNYSLVPT